MNKSWDIPTCHPLHHSEFAVFITNPVNAHKQESAPREYHPNTNKGIQARDIEHGKKNQ